METTVEMREDKSSCIPQGPRSIGHIVVDPYLSNVVQPFAGTIRQLAEGIDDERLEKMSTGSSRDTVS